jgi:GntR family transcriptional regulator
VVQVRVDPHSLVPPSQQLIAAVLDAIANGELRPGDKLPAVRALAEQALVNPNTVGKAWRELEHLGVTEGRNGAGVFVTPGAVDVAKAVRLAETLAAVRLAVQQALCAGHDPALLHDVVATAEAAARAGNESGIGAGRTGEKP